MAYQDLEFGAFKLDFYAVMQARALQLVEQGRHVIICGDLNVSVCSRLDSAHHKDDSASTSKPSPSTAWIQNLLTKPPSSGGYFIDTFRHIHPHKIRYSCWNTQTGARKNNFGSRIDYILCSSNMSFTRDACEDHNSSVPVVTMADICDES